MIQYVSEGKSLHPRAANFNLPLKIAHLWHDIYSDRKRAFSFQKTKNSQTRRNHHEKKIIIFYAGGSYAGRKLLYGIGSAEEECTGA